MAGAARRPHPAAAQPVRPERDQEAPGNHRRRGRGAPGRAPRPHHPGQPAAGENDRVQGHRPGYQHRLCQRACPAPRRIRGGGEDRKPDQARPGIPPPRRSVGNDRRLPQRGAGAPQGHRRNRGRPGRLPAARALHGPDHHRPGHRQGRQHQHRGDYRCDQEAPGDRDHPAAAAGDDAGRRFQRCDLHPGNRRFPEGAPDRRHPAGLADRLAVPAQHALHPDHRHGHSGVADGRGGGDLFLRLHPQFAHHARPAAADRRGGGRRHRGAGEHFPPPRGNRRRPGHRRDQRQPRSDVRGDCRHAGPGVDFRAGDFSRRHHRPVLQILRGGGDLRRAGVAVRVADADADAVLALPQGGKAPRANLLPPGPLLSGHGQALPLFARQGAASPLEGGGADPGDGGGEQLFLHQRGQDLRPGRGRGPLHDQHAYPARLQHRIHRQPFAPGRGTAVPPQGNRHRIRPDRSRHCGAGQPGHGGGAHGAARRTENQAAGRDPRDPQGAGANPRCARFRRDPTR